MVNIPGILGYTRPGAYSLVRTRQGSVALPGGPTITAIMGQGQREEMLVQYAQGSGKDGEHAQFDTRLDPDGRYYQVARYPVIPGSVQLYLNPRFDGTDSPLVEITLAADGAGWATEFGIERATTVDLMNGDTVLPHPTELEQRISFGDVPGRSAVVQGFRPSTSGRLAKLQLWLEKTAIALDDLVVKIYKSDGAGNPQATGALATVTVLNADVPTTEAWVDVEFDLTIPAQTTNLTEGELYFIRIERTTLVTALSDPANNFKIGVNEHNSFGNTWEDYRDGDVTLWPTLTEHAEIDILFRTFMNKGAFGVSYDLYGTSGAGLIDEDQFGIDGYQGTSTGAGFFNTPLGRRYRVISQVGMTEPSHYFIDYATGQIVLDHALNFGDKLIAIYLAEKDLNEFELFFDPDELYRKHGYPSVDNTISQAAYMAFLNGAPVVGAIHSGTSKNENLGRFLTDIYWADAFQALEREDVNFVMPIVKRDIVGEVIMPRYDAVTLGPLTGNGMFLQEVAGGGDEPGINIYPLAVDEVGEPIRLEVYKNGLELVRGVDYTVTFTGPGSTEPTKINLTVAMVDGDHVVANYRPDIDLIASVQVVAMQHCEFTSSVKQRKERMLFTGAYDGFGFDQVLDPQIGVANVFGRSFRVVYFYPEKIRTVINGETAYLDAQYLAACACGLLAGTAYLPEPLTRKELVGFDIERGQKLTVDEINLLASDGITIVEPLSSGGRIVHGMTTVQSSNPTEEEISVVRIRDYVAQVCREVLESRFVGTVIDDRTVPGIKTTTSAILESLVAQRIITQYAGVVVKVDAQEPRQVNVGFDVAPVFPLNWIKIEFSIGVL